MKDNPPAQSTKIDIPNIVLWTALLSLLAAVVLVVHVVSKRPSPGHGIGDLVLPLGYAFEVLMVFCLLWTPTSGIALLVCSIFRSSRSHCRLNAWLICFASLIPFYFMFQIASAVPVFYPYLEIFHLNHDG